MHRRGTLVILAALVIAGCGGAEKSTSSLTAGQLKTRADAICSRLNARITRTSAEAGSTNYIRRKSLAERRTYAQVTTRNVEHLFQAVAELEALRPPPALKARFSQFTHALRGVATGFPTMAELMAIRDPRPRQRDVEFRNVTKFAQQLGLRVCG